MYRLEMTDDLGRKLSYPLPLEATVITIGRRKDNDIVLSDLSVSRNHAQIIVSAGKIEVEDLDSANGVLVNNHRIEQCTEIKLGDELIIGENRFFLRKAEKPPLHAPTSTSRPKKD